MSATTRTKTSAVPTLGVPSAPPLPEDLEALLRRLRLPHIRRHAPEVVATAKAQRWEPVEVLRALFTQEAAGRERSALATRRAAAGFPTGKTFEAWSPQASSIPAPTQQALRTLVWVHRRENLVVCGPSGTGKTFLLEALGQHAVEQGLRVAWFTLEDLGILLRRHRADDTVTKAIAGSCEQISWSSMTSGSCPFPRTRPRACTAWSTPRTRNAPSRCRAIFTRPPSTS